MRSPGLSKLNWLAVLLMGTLSVTMWGCVTYVPIEEYNLARAAFVGAQRAEASRMAPKLWFHAEKSYREGERAFRERKYGEAEFKFREAREFSEKAENFARVQEQMSGSYGN